MSNPLPHKPILAIGLGQVALGMLAASEAKISPRAIARLACDLANAYYAEFEEREWVTFGQVEEK